VKQRRILMVDQGFKCFTPVKQRRSGKASEAVKR
jgi:hypothetical protein